MTSESDAAARGVAGEPPTVSVLIPTYNEAANLPHVLARLPADLHQVIVVDGGSWDGTVDIAVSLRPDALVLRQNRRGKGNAVLCGFAAATGDIVVMLDADGSADPREIPDYVDALTAGADFAKGTRFACSGGSCDITLVRRLGNALLNLLVNRLFGTRYTDLCYGYNAMWRRCLPALGLHPGAPLDEMRWGDGFEIETILNIRAAAVGLRVTEVGSYERERVSGCSHLSAVTDGLRVLRAIAVEKLTGPPAPTVLTTDLVVEHTVHAGPAMALLAVPAPTGAPACESLPASSPGPDGEEWLVDEWDAVEDHPRRIAG